MSLALVLVVSALAAPRFEGPPEIVPLAEAAWAAAEACTGRSPAVTTVTILHDLPPIGERGGLGGLALFPPGKPGRIRLAPDASPMVLAHEVAHAWVNEGPRALVEGRTEILARCVQEKRPEVFEGLLDRASALDQLPDLREWGGDPTSTVDLEASLDAYLGSFRYFRAVAEVVPPERLWAADLTTWAHLESLLTEAGPRAQPALDALRGGPAALRDALLDTDLDGLATLQERFVGTDPGRYDTDGDGWWDGAPASRPEGAVPLLHGRHPICLPRVSAGGGSVVVHLGGALGGKEIPDVLMAEAEPGSLLTWESGWQRFPGGVWAIVQGDALIPNARCGMRPGVTVRATQDVPDGAVERLADVIAAARDTLATRKLPTKPLVVTIVGDAPYLGWRGAELSVPARALSEPEVLGRAVAAFAATRELPVAHRSAAAAALVRSFFPDTPTPHLDAAAFEIAPWTRARGRCDGWAGVLDGSCASPLNR